MRNIYPRNLKYDRQKNGERSITTIELSKTLNVVGATYVTAAGASRGAKKEELMFRSRIFPYLTGSNMFATDKLICFLKRFDNLRLSSHGNTDIQGINNAQLRYS